MLLRTADGAQADVFAGAGWQHDVERANFGHLFEQFARRRAQAAPLHPVLQRAPHDEREEAYENVGLGALGLVMEDGPDAEVVFGDAEAVLDLGQADVGFP